MVREERRGVLQDGGCSSRTVADGDRMQHVGFGGGAPGAADQADAMDLEGAAAARGSPARSCKTKAPRSLHWKELRFFDAVFNGEN